MTTPGKHSQTEEEKGLSISFSQLRLMLYFKKNWRKAGHE